MYLALVLQHQQCFCITNKLLNKTKDVTYDKKAFPPMWVGGGCQLWLDGADTSSMTLSGSMAVNGKETQFIFPFNHYVLEIMLPG